MNVHSSSNSPPTLCLAHNYNEEDDDEDDDEEEVTVDGAMSPSTQFDDKRKNQQRCEYETVLNHHVKR